MRAYKSCASARGGCRWGPCTATRAAESGWPLRATAPPSRKNTRLCASCASWAESARTSSAMAARPHSQEHPRRIARALHLLDLRQLVRAAGGEPLPLIPALEGLAEPADRHQGEPEVPVRRGEQRIEPQRAPQLLDAGGPAAPRPLGAAEQQVHGRVVRLRVGRLLGGRPRPARGLRPP